MFILLLDDDADIRHKAVERHLSPDHVILHTFTADEAIQTIMTCQHRIGLAMLDHDLADFVIEEDGRKTERHGVYFLSRMFNDVPEEKWPAQFILHSGNVVGVKNMYTDLRNRGQEVYPMPFSGMMLDHLAERIKPQ